jgi:transposase
MGEAQYNQLIASDPHAAAKMLVAKDEEIRQRDREIEKLRNHLLNAIKGRFGKKSEKLSPPSVHPTLFPLEELGIAPTEEAAPTVEVPAHTRSVKRKQRELPEGTPVTVINHPPEETECGSCGKELITLRTEVTKIFNYIPATVKLEEHHRPVVACAHCKGIPPITTSLPKGIQLIPRSPAGIGLLAFILVSKFQDHIPLHRQEVMFARLGFELTRNRMCEWLGFIAELLHALHRAIKAELLRQGYLQADETTIKIQEGAEPGRCHTGYLWGLLGPPPLNLVYFHYADSRAGEVPKALLDGFEGVLQTDLYAGYNQVYIPERTVRAGCWAHVRRKLLGIVKLAERDVNQALMLIAELYRIEGKGHSQEELLTVRQKKSAPVIQKLHEHLMTWSARTLPQSEVRKVIQYALTQWEALTLFLSHPHVALDNNLIENQMRPVALGRKNWMFAGSHEGAMRAAIFFSIINSCRLNKVNTWLYLNDVLPRLARGEAPETLLPDRWVPEVKAGD